MKKTIDRYDIRPHIRVPHVTSLKSLMLLLFATWGCFVLMGLHQVAHAADTRGLRVVAKDPASGQQAEVSLYNKSYAVIIGIDKYPNLPPDRQLSYAVRDAQGIEQVMKQLYKFDKIVTLYDQQATRDRILDLLTEELPAQMGEDDSLFIFWAGHGNQEKSREGELGYLIPYDGSPAKIRTNITMAEIRDTISKKIPAKHVFYVMDACYSGLMTTTRAIDSKPRRDLAYLKEITKERVRQVLTAGSKDQEVLDGGHKGHSVFTGRLIEALEAAGDFITANEIQAIIKEKVFSDARARNHTQTPGYGTFYGTGDFVFIPSTPEYRMQQLKAGGGQHQTKIDQKHDHLRQQAQTIAKNDFAIEVVNSYLSVNEYDDMLKYVFDPERIKQLRDVQNVGRAPWVKPVFRISTRTEPQNVKNGDWVKIGVQFKLENNQWENATYYLKKTPAGYKIDWESSSGYNKIKPAEFKVSKPTNPVRVRVLARLDDYYNYEFLNSRNVAYSVNMVDIDQQHYGHGYIQKNSSVGKKIFNALKDGAWHYMVFDIKSLEDGRSGSVFLIHDIVKVDSWLSNHK